MTQNSYFGGKSGSGTYQTIINEIPKHELYIEGFAGKCGIWRNLKTDSKSIMIDKDASLSDYYKSLGLVDVNVVKGPGEKSLFLIDDSIPILEECMDVIDKAGAFIYLDPPYPMDTRKDPRFQYAYMLSDDQHAQLLNVILKYKNARIAISTYPNKMYTDKLGGASWRKLEFESTTRHGRAIEVLWMNYPEPSELHDYQYLGADYRERERIGRKLKRWEAKFRDLPPLEQAAMLQRLNHSSGYTAKTVDTPATKF